MVPKVVNLGKKYEQKEQPCKGLYFRCTHTQTFSLRLSQFTTTVKFKKDKTISCKGCKECDEYEWNLGEIAADEDLQPIVTSHIDGALYRLVATNFITDEYDEVEGYDLEFVREMNGNA